MRCIICSYADFSGKNECIDQSDDMPGRNTVHYRKELKEDVCSYCYSIIRRNQIFYLNHFSEKTLKEEIERAKSNYKKTAPKVPEMSE